MPATSTALQGIRVSPIVRPPWRSHLGLAFAGRESADGAFSQEIVGRQLISGSVLTGTL